MSTKIVKIGHASMSEHKNKYGDAGDSTEKEVCIVNNYDISRIKPYIVLRPKTDLLAETSAVACEAGCINDNIGYSQSSRNTLYNLAKANGYNLATVGLCNTDCSAFLSVCAIAGGANIEYGSNAPTTSNMRVKFRQSGDYDVLTGTEYTNRADSLKRGDILVKEGYHTIMVLENGVDIPEEPTIDEPPVPTAPVEQIVTPLLPTTSVNRQFNYSKSNIKEVYIRVNNEYKQAIVYLSNRPIVLHLNK